MSVSGSRAAADFNLDEFERRLRAAGSFPTGGEDPLFELARLVESSKSEPSRRAAAAPTATTEPERLEKGALRPALEEAAEYGHEIAAQDEFAEASTYDLPHAPHVQARTEPPAKRRAIGWTARVSVLTVAGVAMIGAVLALKGGVPGIPKQPPYIAAALGPTKVAPPSDDTVSAPNDGGAGLLKDNTQSAHVKVVASEEQPVDLTALASTAAASAPVPATLADASGGTAVKGTVDTPVVVGAPAPPPARSQFPDPKPVRTVSLRPDGTPIPSTVLASADASGVTPVVEAAKPPAKPAQKATNAAAVAQPSTPRLELPTKLSAKSSARVAVAKTDTTAPGSIEEAANEPLQPGSPAKPEKAAKASRTQVAATEPAAPAETADSAAATKSSGWAVQLGAPKSEVEANSEMTRLNAKYASALNGSSVGVHKAVTKGETIYRLRVVGLSKADAAALCARVKGDGGNCFIAK
jgi:SPOR domain